MQICYCNGYPYMYYTAAALKTTITNNQTGTMNIYWVSSDCKPTQVGIPNVCKVSVLSDGVPEAFANLNAGVPSAIVATTRAYPGVCVYKITPGKQIKRSDIADFGECMPASRLNGWLWENDIITDI